MATVSGRKRLFRRGDLAGPDDNADLSEDEHAWWAAREEVGGVPRGSRGAGAPADEDPETDPQFADYWTTESLFEHPPGGEPVDEPPSLDDDDPLMDLDVAHLVLQVPIAATWEEITRARRSLVKLYHPDRLLDLSPDAQRLGRDRMAEINLAHATLRRLHFE